MTNLLRHILDLFPRKPKRIATQNMLLAREVEDDNRIDDAILLYRYELMDNPGNVNVHYSLARLYYHFKSDPTSAFYHANRALKLATHHDKALKAHSLGIRVNIHLDLDNTSKALADINQAISLLPNYADFFLQRAEIYFKTPHATRPRRHRLQTHTRPRQHQHPHAHPPRRHRCRALRLPTRTLPPKRHPQAKTRRR